MSCADDESRTNSTKEVNLMEEWKHRIAKFCRTEVRKCRIQQESLRHYVARRFGPPKKIAEPGKKFRGKKMCGKKNPVIFLERSELLHTVPALCLPAGRKLSYKYLFFAYSHLIRLFEINIGCPLACPLCDRI
jgi:hypothetical protein